MESLWKSYGYLLEIQSKSRGNPMQILWKSYGNPPPTCEHLMEVLSNSMDILWTAYGNLLQMLLKSS